ncbi:hypothetical protein F4859DRAFT_281270 [Xylaria cf. heliscus]|nr:hypothetical protein F4859DRAFT_281270 [Xylaria cf. heliscus]
MSATSNLKKSKITDNKRVLKYQPEWDDASLISMISGRSSPVKQLASLADKCSIKTLPMLNKGKNNFPDFFEKLLGPLERRVIEARDLFLESHLQILDVYTSHNPDTAREFARLIALTMALFALIPPRTRQVGLSQRHEFPQGAYSALYYKWTLLAPVSVICMYVHHYKPVLYPGFVYELLEAAETYEQKVRDKATWNLEVHFPLMVKSLRRPGDNCYIKITPCTTAVILPQFRVPAAAAHKVNFAVIFQPTHPSSQKQKNINSWRLCMTGGSINHIDYRDLKERLIAISVETNDDYEKAKLQLIVWQAAQRGGFGIMHFQPEITLGIIIQGHDWYFSLSTRSHHNATQIT